MRILVTGATGFIGSRLVEELAGRHELYALARQPGSGRPDVCWIEHDLAEPLDPRKLPEQVDAVVHLAQSRHYRQFPERASDVFDVNVQSTLRLLEYARQAGARCFLFASSGGIYGYSYERLVESDPVNPLNFYLSSKYMAELLIANYEAFFRTIVFRFFFVFGPGQRGMLVPNLLEKVQAAEQIVIEGMPGLKINPIYVDDAVRAFEPALRLPHSGLFNVAGDETVTLTGLVGLIGEVAGRQPLVEHVPADSAGDLVGDNARMREVLGVSPRTSLHEGLRAMIQSQIAPGR